MEWIVGIIIAVLSAFGGYKYSDMKSEKEMIAAEERYQICEKMNDGFKSQLDSIASQLPKIDTIYIEVKEIQLKTDTIIMVNKQILDNTEEIKVDVKYIRNKLK